jgi:hypothetical protein
MRSLLLGLLVACSQSNPMIQPEGDGEVADGPAIDSGSDGSPTCSGDVLAPFEGGPAYYSKFSKFPSDPSFFPIAVWLQSPSNATKYKAIGINTYIGLYNGPTDPDLQTLTTAGVPAMCDQNTVALAHVNDAVIRGWTQQDEPDNAQPDGMGGYLPCIDPMAIQMLYQTMRAKDATHPVFLNFGRGVAVTDWIGRGTCTGKTSMYADYAKGGDILSFDVYPVNDDQSKLWLVSDGTQNLRMWTNNTKPVWNWIETTAINGGTKPTPAQVRAEVWMALVHGSLGIGYFAHVFKPSFIEAGLLADTVMSQAVKDIDAEITSLAAALNTASIANGATMTSTNAMVPVDFSVKRVIGATYVFAVAMRPGATDATFDLRCVNGGSAEVLGESRNVALQGSKLTDHFADFAVHLYRIP